jgi:hypothetical protein
MALNRFVEAANDFTVVIRLNPKIAGYYDNRQNAFKALGRLDRASFPQDWRGSPNQAELRPGNRALSRQARRED